MLLRNTTTVIVLMAWAAAGRLLPAAATELRAEKPRIAVSPTVYVSPLVSEESLHLLDAAEITGAFEKALRNSRKFTVLARRESVETEITEVDTRSMSRIAKHDGRAIDGKLLERYRVVVALRAFAFERHERAVQALEGRYSRIDRASLAVEAVIADTHNGEIVGSYRTQAEETTAPAVVSRRGGSPDPAVLFRASETAARTVVRDFLDNVFPMRVVNVSGGRVWINIGGEDAVERGERLIVYGQGAALIDPDTGENLGSAEIEKATVEIVDVRPKVSIADIVESSEPVENGDFLRRRP